MIRRLLLLVIAWIVVVSIAAPLRGVAQQTAAPAPDPAFLKRYCITCHNQQLKTAGLALDALDITRVGADAETWEKAVRKIRTGMMPPGGARRPSARSLTDSPRNSKPVSIAPRCLVRTSPPPRCTG